MTDKELDDYMKTINPNFNSHIEKGTIEMNNEYYNLLEEKMARLIAENQSLKKQLHEASLTIQEMTEQDIECPSNCEKLKKLNKQLKDNWNYIKKMLKEARQEEFNINGYCGTCTDVDIDFLLNKMQELEQERNGNE